MKLESILPSFFLRKRRIFPFFAVKLGHFIADAFFPYVTNTQAYQRKSEIWKNESLAGSTSGLIVDLFCRKLILTTKENFNLDRYNSEVKSKLKYGSVPSSN